MQYSTVATTWQAPPTEPLPCTLELRHFSDRERWQRAAPAAIMLTLLGIGSIAIPIIHFFAPPILLTLAVVLTRHHLRTTETIVAATGDCPGCKTRISVDPGSGRPSYPIWVSCPNEDCRERIRITAPAAA